MILSIVPVLTDELILSCGPDVKLIDYKMFNDIAVHPFIATNKWDSIFIIIAKGIRGGYIKQLLTRCNIVNVKISLSDCTSNDFEIIQRLMEVYPDSASLLRSSFMKKNDISGILKKEGATID